jgi:UDP-glucose 4-epimerase
MMRVLVTGASGLVGGRLIRELVEAGAEIRAASRVARAWPGGVEGRVVDFEQPDVLREACETMDAVVNLASMGEQPCVADPRGALRVNGGGVLALACAANQAGVNRFVQVSTWKVYGNNLSGAVRETCVPAPQSHYAITHRVAEDYARTQHPNSVVLRLGNGFGAPVDRNLVAWDIIVNQMCRQAVTDGRIVIASSGRGWRNFVPISDVVRALRLAATDLPAGTYNVGAFHSMQLRDAAERVARVCAERLGITSLVTVGEIIHGERNAPLDYRIDSLAAAGFTPGTSFEAEVSETLLAAQRDFGRGR